VDRSWLSKDTFQVELERPRGFTFEPGQGIRFIRDGLEREYSLICGQDSEVLSICVRRIENGRLSPWLAGTGIGASLEFDGPHGFFVFQPSRRPCVFVATGTGIAPFVSMARSGVTGFFLLHGVPTLHDLHYRSIMSQAAGTFVACISRESLQETDSATERPGRVTDYIRRELQPDRYDFYLCGRREMIGDVTRLIDERFDGSMVYSEIFF
jgi:ferredoxin-NADP reductase